MSEVKYQGITAGAELMSEVKIPRKYALVELVG